MSYLIDNDELIAYTRQTLKSGNTVQYSQQFCEETINADRDYNLVNARTAKVSNAKKWSKQTCTTIAISINDSEDEFVIV